MLEVDILGSSVNRYQWLDVKHRVSINLIVGQTDRILALARPSKADQQTGTNWTTVHISFSCQILLVGAEQFARGANEVFFLKKCLNFLMNFNQKNWPLFFDRSTVPFHVLFLFVFLFLFIFFCFFKGRTRFLVTEVL